MNLQNWPIILSIFLNKFTKIKRIILFLFIVCNLLTITMLFNSKINKMKNENSFTTFNLNSNDENLLVIDESKILKSKFIPKLKTNANSSLEDDQASSCVQNLDFEKLKLLLTKNAETKKKHPKCDDQDWVLIAENGTLYFNKVFLKEKDIEIDKCSYASVKWQNDDFSYQIDANEVVIVDGETLKPHAEFFKVTCKSKDGKNYKSLFARLFQKRKKNVVKNKNDKIPINVMFVGMDSISREDWFENLPLTSNFLINELKSNILNKFNVVGDGTPAALIPLLTGKHEAELPNTLKNTKNSYFVDEAYPLVIRNFSDSLGYATMFGKKKSYLLEIKLLLSSISGKILFRFNFLPRLHL
jgi:hypothetical protein